MSAIRVIDGAGWLRGGEGWRKVIHFSKVLIVRFVGLIRGILCYVYIFGFGNGFCLIFFF